tara:strand:- start:454 stop:627 length:174 start_codon:yes stop_codon:yes gene_type:complete
MNISYTIEANPNPTNSELDAKQVILPGEDQQTVDTYYQYLKRQHKLACHMEDDYHDD